MSDPELERGLALRGVRVSRRFERSYLEEELYEAVYEELLLVGAASASAAAVGGPQTSPLEPAAMSAVDKAASDHYGGRTRVVAIPA
jgi:hypothetical protein